MKTFIVPTDFSDTSKNAAMFAANALANVADAHIILYNVFYGTYDDREAIMEAALGEMKTEMNAVAPSLKITCFAERENSAKFVESLDRLARHQSADMVIIGLTGATKLKELFVGSNALDLINKGSFPVMVVPPDAVFKGVSNVMLTSDFKEVDKTMPVKPLQSILSLFNPFVHVVNVDSEHYVELTEEYKAERAKIDEMLEGYQHEFYFMRLFDFTEAINAFAEDYKIDLILTVPRKHSFLGGLFSGGHTKKLAHHSHVPMIAIHE